MVDHIADHILALYGLALLRENWDVLKVGLLLFLPLKKEILSFANLTFSRLNQEGSGRRSGRSRAKLCRRVIRYS